MASWLGTIARGVGAGLKFVATSPITAGAISVINPPLGSMLSRVQSAMSTIEMDHAQRGLAGTGAEKHTFVVNDFNAGLSMAQEALRLAGKQMTYDGQALDEVIRAQNSAFNAFGKLQASFKVVDI